MWQLGQIASFIGSDWQNGDGNWDSNLCQFWIYAYNCDDEFMSRLWRTDDMLSRYSTTHDTTLWNNLNVWCFSIDLNPSDSAATSNTFLCQIYILPYLQHEITKQYVVFSIPPGKPKLQSSCVFPKSILTSSPKLFSRLLPANDSLFTVLHNWSLSSIHITGHLGWCQSHLIQVVEKKATFYDGVNGVQIDFGDHKPWSSGSGVCPTPGPNPRSSNLNPDMLIFDPDPMVLLAWLWDATRGSGRLSSC